MSIALEHVKLSQEIFYTLLNNHYMLKEEDFKPLFQAYTREVEVRNLLKQQAEVANCKIALYGDVLYLIPNLDNHLLGFTTAELKSELCYSGALNDDYYLAQFMILCILMEFYDGSGTNTRIREFLKFSDLETTISKELENGVRNQEKNETEDFIRFKALQDRYESLLSKDDSNRMRKTKQGMIRKVIDFLVKQSLIVYIVEDEQIIPTDKLNHFMENNLLNKRNLDRVKKVLGELE